MCVYFALLLVLVDFFFPHFYVRVFVGGGFFVIFLYNDSYNFKVFIIIIQLHVTGC